MRRAWMAMAVLVACVAPAAAQEPSFEALGQAPVVAGDRVRARERALDEAMKQAVEQAVGTVLEPDALVARSSELRLRIFPKARSYVANYRVLDEGEQSGLFQMRISAQVATSRLQRDLAAQPSGQTPLPRLSAKLRAVVCVEVRGTSELPVPADAPAATLKSLREVVAARNIEVIPSPEACSVDAAANAARTGAAQGALVGTVELLPAGPIRGTNRVAAEARAKVQLVEADGRVSGDGEATRFAYDLTVERAAQSAARESLAEAARGVSGAMGQKWTQAAPTSGVTVRVSNLSHYGDYQAVVRALASLPGVAAVEPRKFLRAEAELLVRTASPAAQLASGLNRVPPQGIRITVRPTGDGLNIDVGPSGDGSVPIPERG